MFNVLLLTKMEEVKICLYVIWTTLTYISKFELSCLFVLPFIQSYLNVYTQELIKNYVGKNMTECMIVYFIYDMLINFGQQHFLWSMAAKLDLELWNKIRLAKLKCGVPIPVKTFSDFADLYK